MGSATIQLSLAYHPQSIQQVELPEEALERQRPMELLSPKVDNTKMMEVKRGESTTKLVFFVA